jgi:heme-degrading monooxygenase HmoA
MILEHVILSVKAGQEAAFEKALREALPLIAATPGYHGVELRRGIESPSCYLLLVTWGKVEDHTVGFRQGANYAAWRERLHHFYDPPPVVEHYQDKLAL